MKNESDNTEAVRAIDEVFEILKAKVGAVGILVHVDLGGNQMFLGTRQFGVLEASNTAAEVMRGLRNTLGDQEFMRLMDDILTNVTADGEVPEGETVH